MNPAYDVKENWCDEDHAVHAVEYAAVAFDDDTHVLDADVTFDVADYQVTELAAHTYNESGYDKMPGFEVRKRKPKQPGDAERYDDSAD